MCGYDVASLGPDVGPLEPWKWRHNVPPKRREAINQLCGPVPQKNGILNHTVVKNLGFVRKLRIRSGLFERLAREDTPCSNTATADPAALGREAISVCMMSPVTACVMLKTKALRSLETSQHNGTSQLHRMKEKTRNCRHAVTVWV
jgi:hypothetical protein